MNEQQIKAGLLKLTRIELINIFPSFEFDAKEEKKSIVQAILQGDPPEEEIVEFKRQIAMKSELPQAMTYIVVYPIKENRRIYKRGNEYKGKFIKRFLDGGQICVKD